MIRVNGDEDDFYGEDVAALLERRHIESRGIAVAIDGEVIPRSTWSVTIVSDGAIVEIVTAAAGG